MPRRTRNSSTSGRTRAARGRACDRQIRVEPAAGRPALAAITGSVSVGAATRSPPRRDRGRLMWRYASAHPAEPAALAGGRVVAAHRGAQRVRSIAVPARRAGGGGPEAAGGDPGVGSGRSRSDHPPGPPGPAPAPPGDETASSRTRRAVRGKSQHRRLGPGEGPRPGRRALTPRAHRECGNQPPRPDREQQRHSAGWSVRIAPPSSAGQTQTRAGERRSTSRPKHRRARRTWDAARAPAAAIRAAAQRRQGQCRGGQIGAGRSTSALGPQRRRRAGRSGPRRSTRRPRPADHRHQRNCRSKRWSIETMVGSDERAGPRPLPVPTAEMRCCP
jgi:hypothetical protein